MSLFILGFSYTWKHTVFVLLYLAYFTYHKVFGVENPLPSRGWLTSHHVATPHFVYPPAEDTHVVSIFGSLCMTSLWTLADRYLSPCLQFFWNIEAWELCHITIPSFTFWGTELTYTLTQKSHLQELVSREIITDAPREFLLSIDHEHCL